MTHHKRALFKKPTTKTVVETTTKPTIPVLPPATNISAKPLAVKPLAVKQMSDSGIKQLTDNPRVIQLLQAMDTPLGILHYGQQEIDNIATKSDLAIEQIDDVNMDFITDQLSTILILAKQGHTSEPKGTINKLIYSVKQLLVDVKEQSLAQINTISTQMDRVVDQINQSTDSIRDKVNRLTVLYQDNLQEYNNLTALIDDARIAITIKEKEYDNIVSISDKLSPLELEQANRLRQQIDRLDKKLITFEKMQFVAMQTAPVIRSIQENGYTLLEKFHTIKTITIPMWKKQARLLSDSSTIAKGAALANDIDDANNKLMLRASEKFKEGAIATATANQRDVIDTDTLLTVNQTLIDTFTDVLAIDTKARQDREESRRLIETAKSVYASALTNKP